MIILQAAQEKIRALQFSPDGRALAAPCSKVVQLWHHPFGGPPASVLEHQGVAAIRFTPDGRRLLFCGPPVGIADLSSRKVTAVPLGPEARHTCCDLSPDGRALVIVQIPRPDPEAVATSGIINAWLDVKARLTCWPTADPRSCLWSVDADGKILDPPLFLPGGERFVSLERRRDGARFFVTRDSASGTVRSAVCAAYTVLDNPVLSPDGRLIACREGVQIAVYRVDALGEALVTLANDNPKQITGAAFHPSGRYLAASSNDATVKLYDTATWKLDRAFAWGIGRLKSVAFSPDGMLAAAGGDGGKIVVWDVDP
jgi:WD40 repeat protein